MDIYKEWIWCGKNYDLSVVLTNNLLTLPNTAPLYFKGSTLVAPSESFLNRWIKEFV